MSRLLLPARLVLGAWMLFNGLNHFVLHVLPPPTGHSPLATQLMDALMHSGLYGVAMTIQLVAGALLLAGVLVPVALCVLMPVSTCALYWAVALDRQPLSIVLALAAFALNGLLMLGYLEYYRGVLQRRPPAFGEEGAGTAVYDVQYATARGRSPRAEYVPALLTLLLVVAFYAFIVNNRTATWCLLMLLVPATVLHGRRVRDMGHTAWLLLVPVALMTGAFAYWLGLVRPGGALQSVVVTAAFATCAGVALWGCLGRGRTTPELQRQHSPPRTG